MKAKIIALTLLFMMALVPIAYAPWSTLSSGYAIWTDYHGIEIPLGTVVTATAGTTEHPDSSAHNHFPNVTHVKFRWMAPNGSETFSPLKPLTWDGTTEYDGWPVYTANDTLAVDAVGDWGVQAWFYDTQGGLRNEIGLEKIRAISIHTIPELPIVGTAGIAAIMLLGFGLYWHMKKKNSINKPFLTA